MQRASVNGAELEYERTGTGEPVLLVHGSHIARSFLPLVAEPTLRSRYSLIRYHRRGFLGSSPPAGPVTIEDQAADARALLDHLGVERAHVVAHSYGGPIALQLAADAPDRVHSLVLLEAALLSVPSAQAVIELVAAAGERYRHGDWEAAQDLFLGSPAERATLARQVPGSLEHALRDMDTYFGVEAPAHEAWRFTEVDAQRITAPVLFVLGADSSRLYVECRDEVSRWLPRTETAVLAGATHLLQMQQPAGAAAILAEFFDRHPMAPRRQPSPPRRWRTDLYNAASDLLDRNLEEGRADKAAIRTYHGDLTYAAVATAANRAGNALRELGVRAEERVLMAVPDSPEFAATFFGAIKIGAVPVPVSTNLSADEYAHLLADSRASLAVVSEPAADAVRKAQHEVGRLRRLVVLGAAEAGETSFEEVTAAADAELAPADTGPEDVCFWLYSSGTTGRPKGVVHLQTDMRFCAEHYAKPVLGLTEADTTFSVSKLYFAFGLGNGLYFPFSVGATSVLAAEPMLPRVVFDLVRRFRPTVYFAVPTSFASLLAAPASAWRPEDFASVRVCVSAGESLPGPTLARWREQTGLDILDGIGSTESGHIFISSRLGDVRPDCTGTVVDGYDARVVDDGGQDLPAGQAGRLLVRGGSICAHYWRQWRLTRQTLLGEWLTTGDVYSRDETGHFYYQGRDDEMLKVGGMWVSPAEIEQVLAEMEQVVECAVVGVPDRDLLVKPEAFVVVDGGGAGEALADRLRQRIRQRLGGNKTPRAFHFVPELPRTETGKVARFRLRELAERHEP